ncbi:hypothetical protein EYF80_051909 [Liparis tanakae]|uniref:Uncharacterized protein n=1 Tax=Liparis tanakae TaxID=230148 RepID=A0A4Z2FAY9_9TELE|nr:hypothetical protein EYF80_051909 [Liparis tanakae]
MKRRLASVLRLIKSAGGRGAARSRHDDPLVSARRIPKSETPAGRSPPALCTRRLELEPMAASVFWHRGGPEAGGRGDKLVEKERGEESLSCRSCRLQASSFFGCTITQNSLTIPVFSPQRRLPTGGASRGRGFKETFEIS